MKQDKVDKKVQKAEQKAAKAAQQVQIVAQKAEKAAQKQAARAEKKAAKQTRSAEKKAAKEAAKAAKAAQRAEQASRKAEEKRAKIAAKMAEKAAAGEDVEGGGESKGKKKGKKKLLLLLLPVVAVAVGAGVFFFLRKDGGEEEAPPEPIVPPAQYSVGGETMVPALPVWSGVTVYGEEIVPEPEEPAEGEEGEEGETPAEDSAASGVEFTPMLYTYQDLTNARALVSAYTTLMTTEDAGFFVIDETMTKIDPPSFDGETPPTSGTVQLARNMPESDFVQSLTLDWKEGSCTVAVELPAGRVKDPTPPSSGSSGQGVTKVIESLKELPPSVLGLEGDSMDDYRIYTQDGIAWVDEIPCLRMSVYRMEEGGVNEIAGHFFLSTDGQHVYKLNVGTNKVVELDIQDALK